MHWFEIYVILATISIQILQLAGVLAGLPLLPRVFIIWTGSYSMRPMI